MKMLPAKKICKVYRQIISWFVQDSKRQFKSRLVLSLLTTKRASFHEQIDRVGLGSPFFNRPGFCIFMNYVIEKTKKFNVQVDVFFRYVNDCFAVFPDYESIMLFHKNLNQVHNNVKFTCELKLSKQLPFLDANVDNSEKKLELSIYRKSTHTGQ